MTKPYDLGKTEEEAEAFTREMRAKDMSDPLDDYKPDTEWMNASLGPVEAQNYTLSDRQQARLNDLRGLEGMEEMQLITTALECYRMAVEKANAEHRIRQASNKVARAIENEIMRKK